MDIGRSFTFITEDKEWWQKVLLGGLLSLIPIVGQFYAVGYSIQVLKATIEGREIPLPETVLFGSWVPITTLGIRFSRIRSEQGGVFP